MLFNSFVNFKHQVRFEESGEGVGARDPMEGIKAQKGEVSKRLEDMKQAESQYKDAIQGLKNDIATLQGKNIPELSKKKIEISGEISKQRATIEGYKKQLFDLKAARQETSDNNVASQYNKPIEDLENAISQINDYLKKLSKDEATINEQLEQIREAIAARQRQLQQYQQALVNIQAQIAMANAQKKGLEIQLKHMAGAVIRQREIQSGTKKKMDAIHAEQGAVAG